MLVDIFNTLSGILLVLFLLHYIYSICNSLLISAMQAEDAKYLKKRWKGGSIEPHPTEKAIIVNYQLEAAVYSEPGDPMLQEKKDCQRIIRLRSLNSKSDIAALAKEVVEKCDLIHKSQLPEVEQIIYYLKNRKDSTDNLESNVRKMTSRSAGKPSPEEAEKANISSIDQYVELLYEELHDRIKGSSMILQLARNPDNLEALEQNETALSALSRVLREDWKKNLDLSTNIIYIFFCFSTYTRFHPVIVQYKIGSLCMDVIDYELRRYESMRNDLDARKNRGSASSSNTNLSMGGSRGKDLDKSEENLDIMNEEKPKDMEPPRRRIPELKQRPKSGNWSSFSGSFSASGSTNSLNSLTKSLTLSNSYYDKLNLALSGDGSVDSDNENRVDPKKWKEDYEQLNRQLKVFAKKQEQLLRVAFYLLLNIAENVKLEEKMRKKMIVKMLIKALERQNIDLLVLVVTFLKKLSIVRDNKDEMYELNVIEKLPRLLQSSHPDLIQVTLKLIFNLSFDARLRAKMIRVGFLPKLVTFLSDDKHHGVTIKILYHMSLDDKVKSMFMYTECVPLVTDMLILNLSKKADVDLIALCINLALSKKNAQIMVETNRLYSLMTRAFKYQDYLLMKMIRNISSHEGLRHHFIDYVGDLAKVVTVCENDEFVVECLGILANLSLPDLDYAQILHNFNMIPWIRNVLVPGKKSDDLVLEAIIFLGTCACDEACAMLLCKADLILSLIELLKAKQEDDEIVLQITFVFQQILRNESTRDYIIKETESPAYLIDLMHDKNSEIRKVCDCCLDLIAITDSEWATRLKLEKFRNHNLQWLNMVETQQDYDDNSYSSPIEYADHNISPYLTTASNLDQFLQNAKDESEGSDTNSSRPMSSQTLKDFDQLQLNNGLDECETIHI